MAKQTTKATDDPIVLAVIEDQALLKDEYSKTQKKLKALHQKIIHNDLGDTELEEVKQEIQKVKNRFKAFSQMITQHAQWLEKEAKK